MLESEESEKAQMIAAEEAADAEAKREAEEDALDEAAEKEEALQYAADQAAAHAAQAAAHAQAVAQAAALAFLIPPPVATNEAPAPAPAPEIVAAKPAPAPAPPLKPGPAMALSGLINNGGNGGIAPVEMGGLPLINHTLTELKERAATLGITTPAGHKGKRDTWIVAIKAQLGEDYEPQPSYVPQNSFVMSVPPQIGGGGGAAGSLGAAALARALPPAPTPTPTPATAPAPTLAEAAAAASAPTAISTLLVPALAPTLAPAQHVAPEQPGPDNAKVARTDGVADVSGVLI